MSSFRKASSSHPLPGLAGGGGCVVNDQPVAGFGFTRTTRLQMAALAAILLATMAFLGFAAEVMAALLAALLLGVAVDAATSIIRGGGALHRMPGRDAG
ncbi:hypothetical protein NMG29_39305 [Streptomyces cocklensis]|uniref:Uncharacterized protein n=1 Tax=Actinacidiphila cocklensis TaxID=887465 RepID=A0A9W4GUS6_9ACTN|nr:hypothetical protein [Actinacidiphila cocklensis]MDD1064130.1 hypothetical protein [Actinacidiphila cocklensis]CAG6397585.1 hypothetical protein SCOCK_580011 [Actinacidiphila cocklensis]